MDEDRADVEADRVAETHVSTLVFLGDRVFKAKKPVQLGFVDLRSSDARADACRDEVRLNSRLAPDVYDGVGSFRFPDGRQEPVVVLKRLPSRLSLSALVQAGDPEVERHVTLVAQTMADFHHRANRGPSVDAAATPSAVAEMWSANETETLAVADPYLDPVGLALAGRMARRFVEGRADLFEQRIAAHRVVDGHGDLLADDIFCLDDHPRILDCLEFSDSLRYGDGVLDVAFLAMDLERLGRPDLAGLLWQEYRARSGDSWPDSLSHFYIAYRASVRAKVACIQARLAGWTRSHLATRLQALCLEHLHQSSVRLVLVGGLPGAGKSTLAQRLASQTGWPVLNTDAIRKARAGLDAGADARNGWQQGIYSPSMTATVYRDLLGQAVAYARMGQSVLLDGSWTRSAWRAVAASLADRVAADLAEIRCDADQQVREARILDRLRSGRHDSDATPSVARLMEAEADPWREAVTIDTSEDLDAAERQALQALGVGMDYRLASRFDTV